MRSTSVLTASNGWSEDVVSALRSLCLERIPEELVKKLHKAFVQRSVQDNDKIHGPCAWLNDQMLSNYKR